MSQFFSLKSSVSLAAFLMATIVGSAQRPHPPGDGPNRERLETLRVAFMTERLELTSEEAERFWPVFNAHQETLRGVRESLEAIHDELVEADSPSDAWLNDQLDEIFALRTSELAAERAMIEAVAEILGLERAMKLPMVEGQFRHRIMEEVQKRRSAGGPPTRPQRP
jgi:hypothetical protein